MHTDKYLSRYIAVMPYISRQRQYFLFDNLNILYWQFEKDLELHFQLHALHIQKKNFLTFQYIPLDTFYLIQLLVFFVVKSCMTYGCMLLIQVLNHRLCKKIRSYIPIPFLCSATTYITHLVNVILINCYCCITYF